MHCIAICLTSNAAADDAWQHFQQESRLELSFSSLAHFWWVQTTDVGDPLAGLSPFSLTPMTATVPGHSSLTVQARFAPTRPGPAQQQLAMQLAPATGTWEATSASVMLSGQGLPEPIQLQAQIIDLKVSPHECSSLHCQWKKSAFKPQAVHHLVTKDGLRPGCSQHCDDVDGKHDHLSL